MWTGARPLSVQQPIRSEATGCLVSQMGTSIAQGGCEIAPCLLPSQQRASVGAGLDTRREMPQVGMRVHSTSSAATQCVPGGRDLMRRTALDTARILLGTGWNQVALPSA